MPVRATCFSIWYMRAPCSKIVPAVGQVERLVDQRKIRDDIAEDRALDQRPVLPRRIVRVHAVQAPAFPGVERDQHVAAPALDPADAAAPRRGYRHGYADRARRQIAD